MNYTDELHFTSQAFTNNILTKNVSITWSDLSNSVVIISDSQIKKYFLSDDLKIANRSWNM
jgi:hypothetical protein